MTIRRISYRNFRNIEEATLELHPEVNLLFGQNAQGKTNALEGICLLAGGRSYRTGKEREFLLDGSEFAEITAEIETKRRGYSLQMAFYKAGGAIRKKCLVNGIPVRKMSEFVGILQVVTFFPEHLAIVREGPALRRNFLDSAISQVDREYLQTLQKYMSVLEQRNSLLQRYFDDRATFEETIGIWNRQMAVLWESIAVRREKYLGELQGFAHDAVLEMSGGKEILTFGYKSPLAAEEYEKILSENLGREAAAGSSQYGAHREDFEIRLNDKSARAYASQGQCRSIAVAMKVAEAILSRQAHGEEPVVLLDDVLSELDRERRQYLLYNFPGLQSETTEEGRQVIITGCEDGYSIDSGDDSGIHSSIRCGKRFYVEAGSYREV